MGQNRISGCTTCRAGAAQCCRCEVAERIWKYPSFQRLVSYVYGVAAPGEKPSNSTPFRLLALHYLSLTWTVSLSASLVTVWQKVDSVCLHALMAIVILVANLSTTGRIRASRTVIMHFASHSSFGKHSDLIGMFAGVLTMQSSYVVYCKQHPIHHAHTAEETDPELAAVRSLGFPYGLKQSEYSLQLFKCLLSCRNLWEYMRGRARSYVDSRVPRWHLVAMLLVQVVPIVAVAVLSLRSASIVPLIAYIFAWFLPMTYLSYISFVIYAIGLHVWEIDPKGSVVGHRAIAQKTGARFLGDHLPDQTLVGVKKMLAWSRFWFRFVVVHWLIGRVFVLPLTSSHHDCHHHWPRGGKAFDWINPQYDRHRVILGHPEFTFWQSWGLMQAINTTFASFASVSPEGRLPKTTAEAINHLDNM